MPLDLARRVGVALDLRSETRIRQIDRALKEYVRLTPQSPTIPSGGPIDASQVISGTLADARVAESNVTQHEGALSIDWMQLTSIPSTFTPSAHTHAAGDIVSGTFADARVAQSNVTQHQAALSLAATQLVSGVLADARVQESNVTQHEAALSIDWMQLTGIPSTFPPDDHLSAGTWTPTDDSGAALSFAAADGTYFKHEGLVFANCLVIFPATADGSTNLIGGLPFTVQNASTARMGIVVNTGSADLFYVQPVANTDQFRLYSKTGTGLTNAQMSGQAAFLQFIYPEA